MLALSTRASARRCSLEYFICGQPTMHITRTPLHQRPRQRPRRDDHHRPPGRPAAARGERIVAAVVVLALIVTGVLVYRARSSERRHVRHDPGRAAGSRADRLGDRDGEPAKHDQRRHASFGDDQRDRRRLQLQGPRRAKCWRGSIRPRLQRRSTPPRRHSPNRKRRPLRQRKTLRARRSGSKLPTPTRRPRRPARAPRRPPRIEPASDRGRAVQRHQSPERAASRAADRQPRQDAAWRKATSRKRSPTPTSRTSSRRRPACRARKRPCSKRRARLPPVKRKRSPAPRRRLARRCDRRRSAEPPPAAPTRPRHPPPRSAFKKPPCSKPRPTSRTA